MSTFHVERTIWLDAPIARAWDAVTQPQHLDRWYATLYRWDIPALDVGTTVRFFNSDPSLSDADAQTATIEVVDPPREFTLRWAPAEHGVVLVTSFLLTAENNGTRVSIVESGYEFVPEHERQQWIDASAAGYALSVENLQAYLEGRPIPH